MSVSEYKYAVFSCNVWSEWVELDDEMFVFDQGECVCLLILKCFYFCIFSFKFHFS